MEEKINKNSGNQQGNNEQEAEKSSGEGEAADQAKTDEIQQLEHERLYAEPRMTAQQMKMVIYNFSN